MGRYVGGHADLFVWWDGLKTDAVMRDYLQFCRELLWLRRREPALSSEQLHVSTQNGLDRVIAIHRWVENAGNDLLVVANLQEWNRYGYRVGFPAGGPWREIFNSDVYDTMPNPAAVGNDGRARRTTCPGTGCRIERHHAAGNRVHHFRPLTVMHAAPDHARSRCGAP